MSRSSYYPSDDIGEIICATKLLYEARYKILVSWLDKAMRESGVVSRDAPPLLKQLDDRVLEQARELMMQWEDEDPEFATKMLNLVKHDLGRKDS